jgi:hypothetical protein
VGSGFFGTLAGAPCCFGEIGGVPGVELERDRVAMFAGTTSLAERGVAPFSSTRGEELGLATAPGVESFFSTGVGAGDVAVVGIGRGVGEEAGTGAATAPAYFFFKSAGVIEAGQTPETLQLWSHRGIRASCRRADFPQPQTINVDPSWSRRATQGSILVPFAVLYAWQD